MPKRVNHSSDEVEGIELPMYPIYTDEFDRECSAEDLYKEKGGNIKRKHTVLKGAREVQEKLFFIAKSYKEKSLKLYGYIPPIVFVTDNSGSLRGAPASYLEGLLRVVSEAFEQVGIPFEILGYTTRNWKGGKSREKWLRSGRPRGKNNEGPGRLCDIQHTVFKGFGDKFSDVKEFYGLLAAEGYLKENLDGEALIWAYERISQKTEQKKHIVHLSDGAPVDDSTLSVNPADFLLKHLQDVLIELKKDSNVKVHQGFIYDKYSGITKNLPYDSHSLLKPSGNPLDDFMEQLFPALMEMSMDEIIENRKKELSEILGEEASLIGEEDLLFITRNFNPEILKILKEFGYSGVDILLHVQTSIEDIDEHIFRMNLGIIKHSGKNFGEEFGKLIPILVHYPYHEHLQFIISDSDNIDAIIITLKNSDKFIQITQGEEWQKNFFEKYRILIEQDRLNVDILSFLIEGAYVLEEDVNDLYIVLQFGNFETVKVLLGESDISYSRIRKERDLLEYSDPKKLKNNIQILKKKGITHESQVEVLRFCMSVNTLMLQAAIQYGCTSYKLLKKIQSTLEKPYTAESEKELIEKIINQKEKSDFSKNMIIKAPFMTLMGTIGFSNFTYTEGLMVFLESFNNLGWFDLAAFWFFYLSGKGGIQRFKSIKANTQTKSKDAVILRNSYKNFKGIFDNIVQSKYTKFSKEDISELKEAYKDIISIHDEDAKKMIGVDADKIKLQYNVVMLFYIINIIPDLSYVKDQKVAEAALRYIQEILDLKPQFVQDSGYNYKFFLEQKSKLQGTFGADFGESEKAAEKNAITSEVRNAYKILGVKQSVTEEEMSIKYRELVREYHPDRQGGDETKMKEINTAKDIIDKYRGWN